MRFHQLSTLVLLCAAACATNEPTDDGDETAFDDDTLMSGLIDEDLSPAQEEVDLPAMELEKSGRHRITATDFNLHILRVGCYTNHILDWACPRDLGGRDAHFSHAHETGANDVEVADNFGGYDGECVSLVKAATKSNVVTANWHQGANVFDGLPGGNGLPSGTALATFPGGHYFGHTVILLAYVRSHGKIVAIRVADQNWNGRTVKRHLLYRDGDSTSVANANRYFAITVD